MQFEVGDKVLINKRAGDTPNPAHHETVGMVGKITEIIGDHSCYRVEFDEVISINQNWLLYSSDLIEKTKFAKLTKNYVI